ncbi:MAG: amino acid adenylation domain-containing protein [Kofleriaceae bacterium]|nr:amino acid adenylation domain-containing protein [Kofleriaceae bacterium]MBP9165939.1 amino acid adenylation domain-containing protein [Kofleriaceae bacterium]MBP9857598.1 amino acid adenylation domain-containing protein [Kofleriaceae bacterium]
MTGPAADLFDALALAPAAPDAPATARLTWPLTAEERAVLDDAAGGPTVAAIAAWAVVLARIAGAEAARIDVHGPRRIPAPRTGPIAAWLAEVALALLAEGDGPAASGWGGAARDLALTWSLVDDALVADHAPAQLDAATVELLAGLWRAVLASWAGADDVSALSPLTAAGRAQVVETWNATGRDFRPDATVHGVFREVAARAPDQVALLWDGGALTYRELDATSDELAERLIAAGVATDRPVALIAPRSPEAVIAALAILKAGGCYLPLDPAYPHERLRFAIDDAGAKVLVTDRAGAATLAGLAARTVLVDGVATTTAIATATPRAERATSTTRAYVMYTSGSTGVPKGVQIEHRSILRLVGDVDYVALDATTRFLHAAPLGFDASTLELWGPLLHGGAVVIYRDLVPTGPGLAAAIARHGVTSAWLTAALFNSIVDDDPTHLAGLRQLYTGGEALSPSHVRRALAALPTTELHNGYGPTECTTFTTTYRIPRELPAETRAIPIGRPIADTACYVVAPDGAPVPIGIVGELWVGGRGVARGYLARPELDAERFIADRFTGDGRLYRTGDRVRWRPDGTLDFVGRVDQQVKIRGFRIELGEIEARLGELSGVAACAVAVKDDGPTGKRLVAYLVGAGGPPPPAPTVRAALAKVLPEFMVPTAYVALAALPVTANGKLDRARLPAPGRERPELATPYRAPSGPREPIICAVFAELLDLDRVGALDGFFELGGNSLLAVTLQARLREAGLPEVSTATLFAAPTPAALAKAMDAAAPAARATARRAIDRKEPIAIVGMAGRFPGAVDVPALWRNLCDGVESIRYFAPDQLDPSIPAAVKADPAYVAARGVLDGVDQFDAGFFGMSPLEAALTDPQHRVFLETAWHALEHAGHVPDREPGPVGIFGGMYNATYYQRHLWPRPDQIRRLGELAVMLGNEKDYVTTRVAHKLGLTGPAVSVHTACSTSLVATAMAMDALRAGSCDLALAGGVAITCPPASGYLYQDGSMASPDGHTRTFDASAGGTVFSDGVAVVALRRLSDAIADGDTIYAVLLGAAVNNDGAERASFTAPSPDGQAAVIAAALDAAGVDARSISYVEAHGTATPLGDPIEIEGLTRAFRRHTTDRGFCAIGSLKSNVGHMVIAAGASSLIKAALALYQRTLPPSINFTTPNPKIDFASSPFRVQAALSPWPAGATPRRAGVSSFGFGGTNAHIVVEEAPATPPATRSPRPIELVLVSARTAPALADASAALADALAHTDADLADVAHTLQVGRREFDHRRFVVADSAASAARLLTAPDPSQAGARQVGAELPSLGFLCPGQGSQYARMGSGLYSAEPAFRAAYDDCLAILAGHFDGDPRDRLWTDDPAALSQTSLTQPAIFTLEYSLARLWMSWGVTPTVLVGHSVGEFVCAALAEVMSLPDALALVVERGRRMQALPTGSMLSVRLSADELRPRLPDGVDLAAENAPGLCVASGPTEQIAALEAELAAADVAVRRLVTSHAFHSPMMDPVVPIMAERLATMTLAAPRIPIVSTVTAAPLGAAEAQSTRYWAEHLRRPVRFAPAVAAALADPRRVLIEIGPRATLSALARQAVPGKRALPVAVPSLADAPEREALAVTAALGQLWTLGATIDWRSYRGDERRRRVPLPLYPFQRQRHWIDAPAATALPTTATPVATLTTLAGLPTFPLPTAPAPAPTTLPDPTMTSAAPAPTTRPDRKNRLLASVRELVEEVSGADVTDQDPATPWLELGLDSLTLTQLALAVQRAHGVKVTFRQVMESYPSVASLVEMLDASLPPDAAPEVASAPAAIATPVATPTPSGAVLSYAAAGLTGEAPTYLRQVIDAQLAIMAQQLAVLGGQVAAAPTPSPTALAAPAPAPAPAPAIAPIAPRPAAPPKNEDEPPAGPVTYDVKKAFGAIARIHTAADELSPQQRARLDALIARYTARTAKSKAYTQAHRDRMADPRVVNGFRPLTKELTYQLVIERSRGSRLWDLDGHEYIDVLNGFGMNLLGWQPDFLRAAIHDQVEKGYEIGPQHVLAGECAELFCDVTGAERAAFCNTGSEAVMGCMRIARTVTGRSLIAIFTGAYHGIFDEVIVRGTRKLKSIPAAPGIMPSASQNVLVLDYGTPESLEILRQRAHELAAIVVEPVQSRRPDFRPVEFLRELRALSEQSGTLLVFDEVVTGFRAHPRGVQGLFGIEADLASYGKVVGGGFSIGVIAGKRPFMDALDGGHWQYGDDSIPTVGVTYFAGTFVRHPLALATTKAMLEHLRDAGPALQEQLTARCAAMVGEINAHMEATGAPLVLKTFASWWRNNFTEDLPYNDLVYTMLRDRGIHILDNFPCFLTTAHSDADLAAIVAAYKAAAAEMQAAGFWPAPKAAVAVPTAGGATAAPSTEPQREVWLAAALGPEASLAYNESVSLHLRGELDVGALRHAVRELPRRHDALRATFSDDGTALAIAAEPPDLDVPLLDLSDRPATAAAEALAERCRLAVDTPFDLAIGPLVRAELVRLTADHHVLVFTGHHIVLDGWSYWVVVKDLAALYALATGARSAPLPDAPSFATYAAAQAARADAPEVAANERYWTTRFADGGPTLELPTDRPRPPRRTTRSGREDHVIPAEVLAGVKKLGARLGASSFATLLAGFDALLHRLTGADELVVGIPAAGQTADGWGGLVGHCVHMLPIRAAIGGGDRFAELVKRVRGVMLDAYDHQDVTFGRVLQTLPLTRDPSRLPLISVIFNIDQALAAEANAVPGLHLDLASNPRTHETFELFVNAVDTGAGLRLECQYNADLFDAATIRRWLAGYELLLRGALTDPEQPIGRLPVVTDEDRALLATWNATEVAYPRTTRVEALVAATARRVPERIALTAPDRALTYRELVAEADRITAALVAAGVLPGARVGLIAERDSHMVPMLLGILGAGAAYVPLDPSFPAERLAFMIADAGLAIVTASAAGRAKVEVGRARVLEVDGLPAAPTPAVATPDAESAAYIIYTSGSTGTPKGVCVPHRAVVNFLYAMAREPGLTERDRLAAVTTLSFDIAVLELLVPLTVGAEVVLVPRDTAVDGAALGALLADRACTVMQATPATWRLLLTAGWPGRPGFRALCGGEALDRGLATELAARVDALWNLYGPTETTVWSTAQRIAPAPTSIAIGRPIANTTCHVLDADQQPVPIGAIGELYLGGDGVTLGYLDRPELTRERFVPDPFRATAGARLYRTGDLARWRPTADGGVLECLGRTDFQVKLRGYRIELGEIEHALARHAAIAAAAVVAREDRPGDVRLVAYLVAAAGATIPSDDAVRAHLAATLPDYMIPSRFVTLSALPLTGSGKVDRKALPAPGGPAEVAAGPAVAPRTPLEEQLAAGFAETLAVSRLSIHDDFFALGGHSLLAAQLAARLGKQLGRTVPMRALFEHPTVARLAAHLDGERALAAGPMPHIPRRAETGPAPLSLMQERVWYLEQLQLGRTVWNVPSAHRLRGALDRGALERALALLVERHDVLRTAIRTVGDSPAQIVLPSVDTSLPFEELTDRPVEAREAALAARLAELVGVPFDLATAPLYRARLFRLADDEHVLFFMAHHAIWDGWSFDLFYEELADLYDACCRGVAPKRPPPPVTYADFAAWHREWMAGPELERQLGYWRTALAGAPEALDLPTDYPRPPTMSGHGGTSWLQVPPAIADGLRALGLRESATLFMSLLAAWAAVLHRETRQRELVIGTPVRGRNLPELETVCGFFVNALPLRIAVDPSRSFLELVRALRADTVAAFGAQDVPFEHLVRVLDQRRDESRFPIYQAFFSYQDARQRPSRWGALEHRNLPVFQPAAAQDVALWFLDGFTGLVGGLNYNTDILSEDSARRLGRRYLQLLEAIVAAPDRPLGELLTIAPDERAQLAAWNATAVPAPAAGDLWHHVAPGLAHAPDRIAVRAGEQAVTYRDLTARAEALAGALVAGGLGRGDVVALHLERGPTMVAALLACARVGATYLPLDPAFPIERLTFMLADSEAKRVLADRALDHLGLDPNRVLRLDGDLPPAAPLPPCPTQPDDPAYLIYTSGSTGQPKGVLVPHRAIVNFLAAMATRPGLTADDRLAAITTLSFDIAALELWLPLAVGAEIVLATRDQVTDGHALKTLLERQRVTVMQATPATWRLLLEAGWRGGPGFRALCGGEALPSELAEALLERTGELWNMYGPTETTVWSTCARIAPGQGDISIGTPIANTTVWVLDETGRPAPIGVPGELAIGGAGVALGYHRRPELTAERFVVTDAANGARLYRTGDLGRWRADGTLQHLGRTDFQVKVRGYRIELGEIEAALARHPAVAQAVVVAGPGPGGEPRLVAYLVARDGGATPEALRAHLAITLPDYMIPALFVVLSALPLTANGKVDRKALPAPTDVGAPAARSYAAPRTPAEELVAAVWRELLGVERIAVADNFLDLGGHSLLIMRAIARFEAQTGRRLSPRALIFSTLEQVARELDGAVASPPGPKPPTTPTPPRPTPPAPAPTPASPTARLRRWLSSLKS